MAGIYDWIDQNIAQGLLPGGVQVGQGLIPSIVGGGISGALAPLGFGAGTTAAPTGATSPFAGMLGMPTGAAAPAGAARPRARLATGVMRIYENGTIEPVSLRPGRPALMASDYSAARRVKRIGKKINKLYPPRRRSKAKK